VKTEVSRSRHFNPRRFDELVNQEFFFTAAAAKDCNLVDAIGRWDTIEDVIAELEGSSKSLVEPHTLAQFHLPADDPWSERPRIALVYALGVCDMDEGIAARSLVKDIEAVAEDRDIKAVVFRVDSPGGSAIPSDIVAEALKECSRKKPVIVSQGNVAGSGGYWLSMYGDVIVAAPHTITGSIGVIGLWLYDKSLKEKLGLSTDQVKAGDHADLGFGFPFPLVGMLPDRNLNEDERSRMEVLIKETYHDFVGKVAVGRNMEYDDVESIAQGRVWSGVDAKAHGLVDTLGGLITALAIAKQKAGIAADEKVTILEFPKRGLIAPDMLAPRLINAETYSNDLIRLLEFFAAHNGRGLPMLPIEYLGTSINFYED
jgi:protease-4